jgi:hypothetical protein
MSVDDVPVLHLTLRETRRELEQLRELAVELAEALDREVDARYGRAELDRHATSSALHRARCEGLL